MTEEKNSILSLNIIGVAITVVVLWGLQVLQLRYHWGAESYYNYGWAIPVIGAFLFYKRIVDAPPMPSQTNLSKIAIVAFVGCALMLIPFRLLNEVNPFWRIPLLAQGMIGFIASLCIIAATGGMRTMLHFAFPCFFLLTMIPWPYQIEVQIVHAFTQATAQATVVIVQLFGHPAILNGNIITVGDETVSVGDACSGIRSLQALSMIALFLGEYFRFNLVKRIFLILFTLGAVLFFNMSRAVVLTLVVIEGGTPAYEKWHDPVGTVSFVLSVIVLYGMGEVLSILSSSDKEKEEKTIPQMVPLPKKALIPLVLLLSLPEVAVEGWFTYKESQITESIEWDVEWPPEKEGEIEFLEIDQMVTGILGYDYGKRARIRLNNNIKAEMYYYGYTGDNKMTSVSSYGHSPTICMEATGAQLISEVDTLNVEIGELTLPLRHFRFQSTESTGSQKINVFWCVWEKQNMGVHHEELASLSRMKQLQLLSIGRRDYSRQVVLVSVVGEHNMGTVRILVSRLMNELIRPGMSPKE